MTARLAGKTALVTGAGAGIGRAIALAFAAEGARVIATNRSPTDLGLGIETRLLDVGDPAAIAALAADIGAVDVLANVAGYVHAGTILDCTEDDWARSFDTNVTAIYRLTRALLPAMLDNGGASIVNVASVAGAVKGVPGRFAYGASKAAVVGLTRALAADFITSGIRANVICPGTVDSPSLDARARATEDYEATRRAFIARQPLGRLGRPEEIASLAVHLASDESGYTTGAVYIADGGATL